MNTNSYQRAALNGCLHAQVFPLDNFMDSCGAWRASVENISHEGDHCLFSETDHFSVFYRGQGLNTVDTHIPRVSGKWHGIDNFNIDFIASFSDGNTKDMMVFGKDSFSASKPLVSEPVLMLLMGAGMLGLSGLLRRKIVKNHDKWLKNSVKAM